MNFCFICIVKGSVLVRSGLSALAIEAPEFLAGLGWKEPRKKHRVATSASPLSEANVSIVDSNTPL